MAISPISLRMCAGVASLLFVSGCMGSPAATRVQSAKTALIGLSKQDVRMCAGFPQRHHEEDGITTWGYETRSQAGGVNLSAPLWIANTNLSISGGGNCQAQFQFENGYLTRLAYAGDNDSAQGRDTMCTPIIDGCLAYVAENSRR